jgi:hypothetical protein
MASRRQTLAEKIRAQMVLSIIHLQIATAAAVLTLHELNTSIYAKSHYPGQAGTWLARSVAQAL